MRGKITNFAQTKSLDGKIKVIIMDEFDNVSLDAQKMLRNLMEEYAGTCRFLLTCNYPFKIIPALHSRCQSIDMTPPFNECVKRVISIIKAENVIVDEDTKPKLLEIIKQNYPDLRRIINKIQSCIFDNKLVINDVINNNNFATEVFNWLINKKDIEQLRKYIIENEINFNNDYHSLLKGMFEAIFHSNLEIDKKRSGMLIVSNCMYQHQLVLDTEINCYSCIIELSQIL
jgi:DNA polymerase III delta prime subunit